MGVMIELKRTGFRRNNMGWKSFSDEEILELKSKKQTHTVSTATIKFRQQNSRRNSGQCIRPYTKMCP